MNGLAVRFLRHQPADRRLLSGAVALFAAAHVLTSAVGMPRARRWLAGMARVIHTRAPDAARLGWCIAAVDRALPGHHSCLVQAVVCEAIARNSRIAVDVVIGAARAGEKMRFHAWVEHNGLIITGAHDNEFAALQ